MTSIRERMQRRASQPPKTIIWIKLMLADVFENRGYPQGQGLWKAEALINRPSGLGEKLDT